MSRPASDISAEPEVILDPVDASFGNVVERELRCVEARLSIVGSHLVVSRPFQHGFLVRNPEKSANRDHRLRGMQEQLLEADADAVVVARNEEAIDGGRIFPALAGKLDRLTR